MRIASISKMFSNYCNTVRTNPWKFVLELSELAAKIKGGIDSDKNVQSYLVYKMVVNLYVPIRMKELKVLLDDANKSLLNLRAQTPESLINRLNENRILLFKLNNDKLNDFCFSHRSLYLSIKKQETKLGHIYNNVGKKHKSYIEAMNNLARLHADVRSEPSQASFILKINDLEKKIDEVLSSINSYGEIVLNYKHEYCYRDYESVYNLYNKSINTETKNVSDLNTNLYYISNIQTHINAVTKEFYRDVRISKGVVKKNDF